MTELLDEARAALSSGEHRRGLELAQQARQACEDAAGIQHAQALTLEGHHLWRLGRFEDAVVVAREAVHQWRELEDPAGQADGLCLLAVGHTELGLHEEGLKCATAAFEIARAHGLPHQTTLALNRIGVCHERLGDPAQGERFLLQALSRAREERSFDDTLQALNNLMANTLSTWHLHRRHGEADVAAQALQRGRLYGSQAVAMARRDGDVYRRIVAQGNLAEAMALAGDFDQAQALIDDTLKEAHAHGYRAVEVRTRHTLGEMRLMQGRAEEAIEELQEVLEDLRRHGDHETTRMRVHSALHRACKSLGRFEPALEHCEAYFEIEMRRASLQAQAQARLMVNRLEMEQALLMADRALMDAAREKVKASELEHQKKTLEERSEAFRRDAQEDALTGLHNRRQVDQQLPGLLAHARASGQPLFVAALDVDHFKRVNDQHGHAVGDEVLRTVAQVLRDRLRASDLAARVGGEEFVVALVDTLPGVAADVCERLRAAVQGQDWAALAPGLAVTVSIGLAQAVAGEEASQVLDRADQALYRAKKEGRNRVCRAA